MLTLNGFDPIMAYYAIEPEREFIKVSARKMLTSWRRFAVDSQTMGPVKVFVRMQRDGQPVEFATIELQAPKLNGNNVSFQLAKPVFTKEQLGSRTNVTLTMMGDIHSDGGPLAYTLKLFKEKLGSAAPTYQLKHEKHVLHQDLMWAQDDVE